MSITITHYVLHDDGRYVMSVWTRPNQQYRIRVLPAFIWRRSRRFSLPIASVYMSNHSPHSFSPSQFCPTSDMFSNILYVGINLPSRKSFSNKHQSVAIYLSSVLFIEICTSNYVVETVIWYSVFEREIKNKNIPRNCFAYVLKIKTLTGYWLSYWSRYLFDFTNVFDCVFVRMNLK